MFFLNDWIAKKIIILMLNVWKMYGYLHIILCVYNECIRIHEFCFSIGIIIMMTYLSPAVCDIRYSILWNITHHYRVGWYGGPYISIYIKYVVSNFSVKKNPFYNELQKREVRIFVWVVPDGIYIYHRRSVL